MLYTDSGPHGCINIQAALNAPICEEIRVPTLDLSIIKKRLLANRFIDANGCWVWTGAIKKGGYGWISVGSRIDGSATQIHTHRAAAAIWLGAESC